MTDRSRAPPRRPRVTGPCVALALLVGPAAAASLSSEPFGTLASGEAVTRVTMTTDRGVSVSFMSYGGAVTDVTAPDRNGRRAPVVLGFPTLREYETTGQANRLYFGAILGRYANFIAGGRFRLDGGEHRVPVTDPPNSIHGGPRGFDTRVWRITPLVTSGPQVSARLRYVSPDGEEGFPGTLTTDVTYALSEDGTFSIGYEATTDRATVVTLSNHMNFNLAGAGAPRGILDHVLTVDADRYLPLDRTQVPLGTLAPVAGTPLDFRRPTAIGARIRDAHPELAAASGYDSYWVLNTRDGAVRPAVRVADPGSGRTLEVLTTEPGVQIYTSGFFDGSVTGVGGRYDQHASFTLETHGYPDSPNRPAFPTTLLRPGQTYRSTTMFRFGVDR